jgi:hypothetical protein
VLIVVRKVAVILRGCVRRLKQVRCEWTSRLDVLLEMSETAWVVHAVFIRICYISKIASVHIRRGVTMSLP